ncbi:hypothetical protein ACPA54_23905 [Uniformispora flossi]|uniref:hypothetical protein n=1 Tax=Uniformispora flossi TaxID=3390723 RepID=UPI003C2C3B48
MSRIGSLLKRRTIGALAGGALVAGAFGAAVAPTAYAGVVNPTVHCVLPAGQGEATGPQSMDVTLTPANAAPGTSVHAVVTLGAGPANSTQSLSNIPTTPSIDLTMSGGATGTVTVTGPTVNLNTTSGQPVIIPTYQGDFMIPVNAQGVVNFTPARTNTKTVVFGGTYNTTCDVVSGGGSIGSVNVQGPGSGTPTLSSPTGTVRPGAAMPFGGVGFPASAAATPSLCPTNGSSCIVGAFTASALSINASGVLSGTATLSTSIPNGNYVVKVDAGGKQGSSPITVEAFVQSGPRVMTMTPSSGPLGTTVTVSGTNWNANTTIFVVQTDELGLDGSNTVGLTSSPDGTFTTSYTITDSYTTQVRAIEGLDDATAVYKPFTIVTTPPSVTAGPTVTHRNGVVKLTGANWPANAAASAALCDSAGNNCNASSLTNSTLAINGSGALTGSVTVGGSVAFGNYTVKVTAGGLSATTPLTVQQRWITLSPDHGPLGTWVTITGKDYANCTWIKIYGINAAGQVTDDYSYAQADCAGNWVTWTKIQDPNTVALVASETFAPSKKAQAPFTITP